METKTVKLYSLDYSNARTYLMAALFIAGNMALPQLFHLIPQGGITWLPIYFFTLIGAYKFGWKVGLLTAILSPIINSLLFGMPLPAVLPAILLKSVYWQQQPAGQHIVSTVSLCLSYWPLYCSIR